MFHVGRVIMHRRYVPWPKIMNRFLGWQYLEWQFGVTIFPMHSPSKIYFDTPSSNILNIVHFLANIREADLASSLLVTGSTREM